MSGRRAIALGVALGVLGGCDPRAQFEALERRNAEQDLAVARASGVPVEIAETGAEPSQAAAVVGALRARHGPHVTLIVLASHWATISPGDTVRDVLSPSVVHALLDRWVAPFQARTDQVSYVRSAARGVLLQLWGAGRVKRHAPLPPLSIAPRTGRSSTTQPWGVPLALLVAVAGSFALARLDRRRDRER